MITFTEISKAPRASFIVFPQQLSGGLAVALSRERMLKDPQPQLIYACWYLTSLPPA